MATGWGGIATLDLPGIFVLDGFYLWTLEVGSNLEADATTNKLGMITMSNGYTSWKFKEPERLLNSPYEYL